MVRECVLVDPENHSPARLRGTDQTLWLPLSLSLFCCAASDGLFNTPHFSPRDVQSSASGLAQPWRRICRGGGAQFEGSCCAAGADKEHANNSAGEALVLGLLGAYSVKLNLVALLRYSPTGCCCLRNTLRQKKFASKALRRRAGLSFRQRQWVRSRRT